MVDFENNKKKMLYKNCLKKINPSKYVDKFRVAIKKEKVSCIAHTHNQKGDKFKNCQKMCMSITPKSFEKFVSTQSHPVEIFTDTRNHVHFVKTALSRTHAPRSLDVYRRRRNCEQSKWRNHGSPGVFGLTIFRFFEVFELFVIFTVVCAIE